MSTHAAPFAVAPVTPRGPGRVRAALAATGAGVLGAAPHVLHHAGPLAGVAGKLPFAGSASRAKPGPTPTPSGHDSHHR